MKNFFRWKVPFYIGFLSTSACIAVAYMLGSGVWASHATADIVTEQQTESVLNVKRLDGFQYIRPLLSAEPREKSQAYSSLRSQIVALFEQKKQLKELNTGAFYFKDLGNKAWTGYNEDSLFNPGSLMKVTELISYLKYEEEKPGILSKPLFYAAPFITGKDAVYKSEELIPGKSYTVKELLRYMISYSDNNATILLDSYLDQKYFENTLLSHNLQLPEKNARNYPLSCRQFSAFLSTIYNGSYLSKAHSEYAAKLLSTCDFKEGFAKGLAPTTTMIHKFGEAGNRNERQLHESAIIYANNRHYLLTVMTKGTEINKLSEVLKEVAELVSKQATGN